MLVGAKNVCELIKQILKLVNTLDKITIESTFPVEPTLTGIVAGGRPGIEPNLKFTLQPGDGINQMKITLKYDRAAFPATVFRAMLTFPEINQAQPPAGRCIWLTIFGH